MALSPRIRRVIPILAWTLVGALLLGGVWKLATDKSGVKREAPRIQTITALPPPPPPPPIKPPPPKLQEQIKQDVPKPNEPPKPADDAPKPITMNADAQAGTDAFGIQAGEGGGMLGGGSGTGLEQASYASYLKSALQQALQGDSRVNRLVFNLEVDVWIDPQGHLTRVALASGSESGDDSVAAVIEAMRQARLLDTPPPASLQFPQRISVRGRRGGLRTG